MASRQNNPTKMLNHQHTDWIFCQPRPVISPGLSPSTPTRRPSKTSTGSLTGARRRNSLKRLSVRTRFGRPPPLPPPPQMLSKAVQSLQMLRDDLAMLTGSHFVKAINTISTQTIEQDELLYGSTVSVASTSKRHSRIPVRLNRCKREKEQKDPTTKAVPSGAFNPLQSPPSPQPPQSQPPQPQQQPPPPRELYYNFSKCNIFSVKTAPIFEVQLQLIDSLSDRSVTVRPSVVRMTASYIVCEVNVLSCPEIKSRTIDVDSTLEDWKPNLADVSIVTGPKQTQKRKSIVKRNKSPKSNDRDGSRKGRESSQSSRSSSEEAIVVVDHSDKVKRTKTSAKRSKSKKTGSDKHNAKSSAHDGGGGKAGESSDPQGEETAINNRVHFSPQVTSSGGCQTNTVEADPSSTAEGTAATAEELELVQRVAEQAISSIAKSVVQGLQRRYPGNDVKATASAGNYSNNQKPTSKSLNGSSNSLQSSSRPQFSLAANNNDGGDDDQYSAYRRNPSQSSDASVLPGSARYGLSTTSFYETYRSAAMSSKSRKELDNRYSHSMHGGIWGSPSSTGGAGGGNGWYYGGSYADSGYYDEMPYRVNPYSSGGCGCSGNARQRSSIGISPSSHYYQEPIRYSRPSDRFSVSGRGTGLSGESLLQKTAFPKSSALRDSKTDDQEMKRDSETSVISSPSEFYNKSSRGVQTI